MLRSEAGADGGTGSASTGAAINEVVSVHYIPLGLTAPSIGALPRSTSRFRRNKEVAVEVLRMEHDTLLEQQTH